MPASFVFGHSFLPPSSVRLGRLVTDVSDPQQDFFDPPFDSPLGSVELPQTHFSDSQEYSRDRAFASSLTSILSASRSKRTQGISHVTAKEAKTYQLCNSGSAFQRAVKAPATREWIEQALERGDDVFMIVGYHTLLDAEVVDVGAKDHGWTAGLNLIDAATLATTIATGVPLPIDLGVLGEVGLSRQAQKQDVSRRCYTATGESISAIQYRKMKKKIWPSRDVKSSVLKRESIWKVYLGSRATLPGESPADVYLEVELVDDLKLQDEYDCVLMDGVGEMLY